MRTARGPCRQCRAVIETGGRVRLPSRSGRTLRLLCVDCAGRLPLAHLERMSAADYEKALAARRCPKCAAKFGDRRPARIRYRAGGPVHLVCVPCAGTLGKAVQNRLRDEHPGDHNRMMSHLAGPLLRNAGRGLGLTRRRFSIQGGN
jgi:hypothetical protein